MNIFEAFTTFAKKDFTNFGMSNNWVGSVKDFGALTAIYNQPVIAGDTWKTSHNVICKLPPLVAPAFTRIKGVINTFYCSYASVWKHWNSFISNKPDDIFLNRSIMKAYDGAFVEPCVDAALISVIAKIAYGYAYPHVDSFETLRVLSIPYLYYNDEGVEPVFNLTWGLVDGLRRVYGFPDEPPSSLSSSHRTDGFNSDMEPITDSFAYFFSNSLSNSRFVITESVATDIQYYARKHGFYDSRSFLVYCCQSVVRNLEAHGIPCDLMARTPCDYYYKNNVKINLLPFFCESSIWHNFFRDEQNQSPELDYSEANGLIYGTPRDTSVQTQQPDATDSFFPRSIWRLRLNGLPINGDQTSEYAYSKPLWFTTNTWFTAFALLTGYGLHEAVSNSISAQLGTSTSASVLPSHYNGLLITKYRNFEKDYFTSACVDPMQGAISVSVPSTIEALRTASKLEEFLERSASARDFYNFMKYNFGTNPESTRYNKPLLLGTKVIPIQIGEQLQTSQTTNGDDGSPLGDRAGVADGYGSGGTADHYFNEHGHIVSFLSFVLDGQYMQGLPHQFMHHKQLDYPFPDFANLGAEQIDTNEIYFSSNDSFGSEASAQVGYAGYSPTQNNVKVKENVTTQQTVVHVRSNDPTTTTFPTNQKHDSLGVSEQNNFGEREVFESALYDNDTEQWYKKFRIFGYVPRYSKWKWVNDVVCGQMRSDMEFWHTFRNFSQRPLIGSDFVSYENAGYISDLNRIFAITNDNADKFILDIFNNCSVRRCLPLVANPNLD
jgi:hypothetical protein